MGIGIPSPFEDGVISDPLYQSIQIKLN
ncbi:hypothetical protein CCACVL1_27943 [Corchorus capsularis]|uniref:Uncharacterized protein n=1 Tax=Corchorus capsularis TaxID=210143 RepID=A0A1R3G822_COCAP|nr:hypothetical protein CCACVL1_27943 [Corchorus capsularis]